MYRRYGLNRTFFTIESYGMRLVARTYDKVDESWKERNRFLGRLLPYDKKPFSYVFSRIYKEKFDEDIPPDAFFLGYMDVPKPSGRTIGATVFSALLWLFLLYLFFLRKWKR